MTETASRRYKCLNCGHEYDEAEGCPDLDVPPGTAWDDLPEDFVCPQCGSDRRDFAPLA
ncbi:MAG TPA: rubredoxin [Novosphingobium sp.]|nr:rubredoxin [Novosphingobium sp.]